MTPSTLNRFASHLRPRSRPASSPHVWGYRPYLEALEDRVVPANVGFSDKVVTVAVDAAGAVYIGGYSENGSETSWIDFNPDTGTAWLEVPPIQSPYTSHGWLAKYSAEGQFQWAVQDLASQEIATYTDAAGETYVYAADAGRALKIRGSDGTIVWDKTAEAEDVLTVDDAGAVYFVRAFSGTIDLDPNNSYTDDRDILTSLGGEDLYVVKRAADGAFQWATQLGGPGTQTVWGEHEFGVGNLQNIAAANGAIYVLGNFNGTLNATGFTDSGGAADSFLIRLDPSTGAVLSGGYQFIDRAMNQVAVDSAGAFVNGTDYLVKLDTTASSVLWEKTNVAAASLAVSGGDLFLTGAFSGTQDFDPDSIATSSLTSTGPADSFVQKLTTNGQFVWAKQIGGAEYDTGFDIAVAGGAVWTVGWFNEQPDGGSADFDPGAGTTPQMDSDSALDGFLSKLSTDGVYLNAIRIANQTHTIDNGDAGYAEMGSGWANYAQGGFKSDARSHTKGNGSNKAVWTFSNLAAGTYQILATWNAQSKNASNAPFTIKVNGTTQATVRVSQKQSPNDYNQTTFIGSSWESLGSTYAVPAGGTLVVELSNAANGTVVADSVRLVYKGPGSLLLAESGPVADSPHTQLLTEASLQSLLPEALARWQAAGADTSALVGVSIRIANLGGTTLGLGSGNTIWLDDDAAGWGWFVDPTPSDDFEFATPGDQGEQGRIDLLTVLMHEIGHLLGLDHDAGGVMGEALEAGTRWEPAVLDGYFALLAEEDRGWRGRR